MDINEQYKKIHQQLTSFLNEFNEEYPQFITNEKRINAFGDIFKGLLYLKDVLNKLWWKNKIEEKKNGI